MAKKKGKVNRGWTFIIALGLIALFVLFKLIGPAAHKPEGGYLYVKTGTKMIGLKDQLLKTEILSGLTWFNLMSKVLHYQTVKPGKYKINRGMSLLNLVRMLRNGRQEPVDFVVTKIRTKEMLAGKIGHAFECDSLQAIQFLNSNDSLRAYDLDSNTVMAAVLPLTYELKWNTGMKTVFDKFYGAYKNFWTPDRKQEAQAQGLSPVQVITLASIVDEETNLAADKSKIASVYMNRVAKGMFLQADPTVKFALKDFGIKRVLLKHLEVTSPYNTYKVKGWPPGPICTPQESTVDAVLKTPKTDYIYFVANSNFDGSSVFAATYQEHQKNAVAYQKALDTLMMKKKQNQQ